MAAAGGRGHGSGRGLSGFVQRAGRRAAAAGRRRMGARATLAPLAGGRADGAGRTPLAPRSLPLSPSSRSAPAATFSAAAAAAARSSGLRLQPQQQQQRQQRRRRRPEAGEGGSQREFGEAGLPEVTLHGRGRGGEGAGQRAGRDLTPASWRGAGSDLCEVVVTSSKVGAENFSVFFLSFVLNCQSRLLYLRQLLLPNHLSKSVVLLLITQY